MIRFIDETLVRQQFLQDERYAPSHGGDPKEGFLGLGMLYYSLAYAYRAKVCVCLGSGSGFVPRLMRQAQRDLDLPESMTILVDADLPGLGYGTTDYYGPQPSAFTRLYPEIIILKARTSDAAMRGELQVPIDYLHIDADHSYEGVRWDFLAYARKVRHVITLHDTLSRAPNSGVWKLIREVRSSRRDWDVPGDWDVLELPLGMGTAVMTRRMSDD